MQCTDFGTDNHKIGAATQIGYKQRRNPKATGPRRFAFVWSLSLDLRLSAVLELEQHPAVLVDHDLLYLPSPESLTVILRLCA